MIERVGGVKGCSNYEYNKDMGITIGKIQLHSLIYRWDKAQPRYENFHAF